MFNRDFDIKYTIKKMILKRDLSKSFHSEVVVSVFFLLTNWKLKVQWTKIELKGGSF